MTGVEGIDRDRIYRGIETEAIDQRREDEMGMEWWWATARGECGADGEEGACEEGRNDEWIAESIKASDYIILYMYNIICL